MKTYILRDPNSVEPQRTQLLEAPDSTAQVPAPPIVATAQRSGTLYIGLEEHTDSIAVSLAPGDSTEPRRYGLIGGTQDDVLRLAKKLSADRGGRGRSVTRGDRREREQKFERPLPPPARPPRSVAPAVK